MNFKQISIFDMWLHCTSSINIHVITVKGNINPDWKITLLVAFDLSNRLVKFSSHVKTFWSHMQYFFGIILEIIEELKQDSKEMHHQF